MKLSFSRVNSLAHKIKKTGKSWSESMKAAYAALKAKMALRNNVVRLTFKKTNGEITSRVATLLPEFLPQFTSSKKSRTSSSPKVSFFSLTDSGFRSFLPCNLISCQVEAHALSMAA